MGIFRFMSLQECEEWLATYKADFLASAGSGQVISISGGGESETRADAGSNARRAELLACMRRMHQLDPVKYPHVPRTTTPDFTTARP
jgi:hypothetical protein